MEGRLSPALQGPCGLTRDGAGPSDKAQVEGRAEQADTPRCHGQTHQWTWAGLDEGGVPPPWQGPSGRGLLPGPCLGPSEDKAPNSGHLKGRARKCVLQGSLHLAEPAPHTTRSPIHLSALSNASHQRSGGPGVRGDRSRRPCTAPEQGSHSRAQADRTNQLRLCMRPTPPLIPEKRQRRGEEWREGWRQGSR